MQQVKWHLPLFVLTAYFAFDAAGGLVHSGDGAPSRCVPPSLGQGGRTGSLQTRPLLRLETGLDLDGRPAGDFPVEERQSEKDAEGMKKNSCQ